MIVDYILTLEFRESLRNHSLVITIKNHEIHMHDMLQELGKKIIRHQFPEEPGSWSRLWRFNDFYHALMTETVTNYDSEIRGCGLWFLCEFNLCGVMWVK